MEIRRDLKKIYSELGRSLIEQSIASFYENRCNILYSPKYQRNYIWDDTKAINLIETILLNGEVPPITVIKVNNTIEIIDGRQRFETIINFKNGDFQLRQFGLEKLKEFDKIDYKNLPPKLSNSFR